jgi:hypothetical protein
LRGARFCVTCAATFFLGEDAGRLVSRSLPRARLVVSHGPVSVGLWLIAVLSRVFLSVFRPVKKRKPLHLVAPVPLLGGAGDQDQVPRLIAVRQGDADLLIRPSPSEMRVQGFALVRACWPATKATTRLVARVRAGEAARTGSLAL